MRARPRQLPTLPALAAGAAVLAAAACGTPPGGPTVVVDGHPVQVEVVRTPEARARGLSGRPSLARGRGMLFLFDHADRHAFWMPDMHFDIDIVWIRDGRIVDITHRVPHEVEGPLPLYRPREPAKVVLEVAAGTAEELGWEIGDPVVFEPGAH